MSHAWRLFLRSPTDGVAMIFFLLIFLPFYLFILILVLLILLFIFLLIAILLIIVLSIGWIWRNIISIFQILLEINWGMLARLLSYMINIINTIVFDLFVFLIIILKAVWIVFLVGFIEFFLLLFFRLLFPHFYNFLWIDFILQFEIG